MSASALGEEEACLWIFLPRAECTQGGEPQSPPRLSEMPALTPSRPPHPPAPFWRPGACWEMSLWDSDGWRKSNAGEDKYGDGYGRWGEG